MTNEQRLIEKLQSIERPACRCRHRGEKLAAAHALERMRQRLAELSKADPPVEHRFSLGDPWSRRLFVACCAATTSRPTAIPASAPPR
jgi:hypothetical protein